MTASIWHGHWWHCIRVLYNMFRQQFYLKTLTTIFVLSFIISYFIHTSTTNLLKNKDIFSSISSHQFERNAADMDYNTGSTHELLFNKQVTNKRPRKYTEKYRKFINIHSIRRKLFAVKRTRKSKTTTRVKPNENYWHELKSNITNLTEEDILKNNFLKALQLTKKELRALEKRTRKQYNCEEWHQERKKRFVSWILL